MASQLLSGKSFSARRQATHTAQLATTIVVTAVHSPAPEDPPRQERFGWA